MPEYDESLIEFEEEQLIDVVTPASVDEIANPPKTQKESARLTVKQKELEWRIRALLRLRNQSIRAHTTGIRYHSFFESIRDMILVADTDRNIVDCNQAFTDLFGYSREEIAGKPTHSVYESKAEFEEMGEAIQGHIGDPNFTKIVSYETKSGEVFPGETNVFYLRDQDGEIQGFVGLIRDVSERLERERELERYEAAVEQTNDLIHALDENYQYLFANEAYCEFHGLDSETITEMTLSEGIGSENYETAKPYIDRALDGEPVTYRMKRSPETGAERTFSIQYTPMTDESGSIQGVVVTMRDLTDQLERETHLVELDRMLRHNLNNEMNVILGRAAMIEEEGAEKIAEHAEAITAASQRLLEQADKERKIVKILSEPPTLRTLDITQRIRSVTERLQEEYPEATFDVDVPAELEILTITEIEQAIEELLENVVVHSAEGPSWARIAVTENEKTVEIEIVDRNPPIPVEERAVLTAERQIDPLTHMSGMGLWLVKRIVTEANGKLLIERRDSKGNRVTIELPR
ncbi:MAG: PAS domain S-box protein [Halodesulfurarchaeum sp.]|nr:PAS domain S-box protein [Halodesulfurarchaeum sp.]